MVPLAPHPCVRWWNTEEMSLKLTRLGLHSLRGGLPTGYYHHPGGVDTNGQGAVFHPLNGRGARGPTGRSNAGRRKQEGYPKVFYLRDNQARLGLCTVVPHHPKISTGLPFLFRSPEPLFLLNQKKKWFWPPLGKRKNNPQPGRQKTNCKIKTSHFSHKRKNGFPRKGHALSVRRRSARRARAVSKRHSRQETACRQRLGCGPVGQATTAR